MKLLATVWTPNFIKKIKFIPKPMGITRLLIKMNDKYKYINYEGIILFNESLSNFQLIDASNKLGHKWDGRLTDLTLYQSLKTSTVLVLRNSKFYVMH